MKRSWFAIKNTVYVNWQEKGTLFLYDTKSGRHLTSHQSKAIELAKAVYIPENLGVVDLGTIDLDDEMQVFIKNICENNLGLLFDKEQCPQKPINFLPILNLQNDVERMSEIGEYIMLGEIINNYLTHAVLHIGTVCQQSCPNCGLWGKQFLCCEKTEISAFMPIERLKDLVKQLSYTSVKVIDLIGGDLCLYPDKEALVALIKEHPQFNWHLWQHAMICGNSPFANDVVCTDILLPMPFVGSELLKSVATNTKVKIHAIVEDEEQVAQAEELLSAIGISDYELHPFYTTSNLGFFEDNVFLNEDDIMSAPVSMREIFCHQKLNTNYFGVLHFFANGEVKADVNGETVGMFPEKSVLELIYEELLHNTAWRRIRGGTRCLGCRFRYLCPSPGNYETVIGKENLCHVQPMRE